MAREKAVEIDARFPSLQAVAEFVIDRARSSPDRMGPSWWGYEAGIASALIGKSEEARSFLHGLTDERVTQRAAPLLPLIDQPVAFRAKVNDMVSEERARLKLKTQPPPFR